MPRHTGSCTSGIEEESRVRVRKGTFSGRATVGILDRGGERDLRLVRCTSSAKVSPTLVEAKGDGQGVCR